MYVSDRKKLFDLVEAAHYHLRQDKQEEQNAVGNIGKTMKETEAPRTITPKVVAETQQHESDGQKADGQKDRTATLIDDFLQQMPAEEPEKKEKSEE